MRNIALNQLSCCAFPPSASARFSVDHSMPSSKRNMEMKHVFYTVLYCNMATRLTRSWFLHHFEELRPLHVRLEYTKYINWVKTIKSPHDYEKSCGQLTCELVIPKNVGTTFMHARRFQTNLVQICILCCAPAWNRRFVLQCCDVPITVLADQESGSGERRLSLVRRRRLSVSPKPTVVSVRRTN